MKDTTESNLIIENIVNVIVIICIFIIILNMVQCTHTDMVNENISRCINTQDLIDKDNFEIITTYCSSIFGR